MAPGTRAQPTASTAGRTSSTNSTGSGWSWRSRGGLVHSRWVAGRRLKPRLGACRRDVRRRGLESEWVAETGVVIIPLGRWLAYAGQLPLWCRFWLRADGLIDLPEVTVGISKVRGAQAPWLVGWGPDKRDAFGVELCV